MADASQYSLTTDATPPSLKRKYDDQSDSALAPPPPSYNSVPPPAPVAAGIELAKQRAQEVAARLLSGAPPLDPTKRPKFDNNNGFDSLAVKPQYSVPSISPSAVAYAAHQGGASKKIDVPNGRVGVIIGKGGETIKYLQLQSGAKIQVTRDMDADPNSPTRTVELVGTPDAIAAAERLINEVLAEAEAGGSGIVSRRLAGQAGSEEFVMMVPNNKVGLVIGKGGETIKNMQASTGARIQVIPLHLPPGDTSTERTLKVEGTPEQIESAKQLVNEVISGENRLRNPAISGGYPQQGYQARPPSSWVPPVAPMQQPGYGYVQPGAYPGPSPQYNIPQPPYAGYPPQSSGGYSTSWDQSTAPLAQQSSHGGGYDYYSQQPLSQQQQNPGSAAPPADGTAYNYSQPPSSGYNQPGQGYGAYHAPSQSGYGQPPSYDQQQAYSSATSYGTGSNSAQEGHTPNYGLQGDSAQVPPVQPPSMTQQGYSTSQQPSPTAANYQPQGTAQPGYGVSPTSQAAYGNQPLVQSGYGPPQSQKPSSTPPIYGQSQSPNTAMGYGQSGPLQSGYPPAQPPPSGPQRAPTSGFGGAVQPGYGPPLYGAASGGQPGYGQALPSYSNSSYGAGYPPPPVYSSDGNAGGSTRGSYDGAPAQTVQQGTVAKTSPQS